MYCSATEMGLFKGEQLMSNSMLGSTYSKVPITTFVILCKPSEAQHANQCATTYIHMEALGMILYTSLPGIVYECAARVNNTQGNERVMFPRYRVLLW